MPEPAVSALPGLWLAEAAVVRSEPITNDWGAGHSDGAAEAYEQCAAVLSAAIVDGADPFVPAGKPTTLIERLTAVLAGMMRDSTDSSAYALGVLWEGQQTISRYEHQEAALRLIGARCESFTRGRCSDPYSGRVLGLPWGAEEWCDGCIAHAALTSTWPTVTDSSSWGVITANGRILTTATMDQSVARLVADENDHSVVIREARPGVWVVAP